MGDGPEVDKSPLIHQILKFFSVEVPMCLLECSVLNLSWTSLTSMKENIVRKPVLIFNIGTYL